LGTRKRGIGSQPTGYAFKGIGMANLPGQMNKNNNNNKEGTPSKIKAKTTDLESA